MPFGQPGGCEQVNLAAAEQREDYFVRAFANLDRVAEPFQYILDYGAGNRIEAQADLAKDHRRLGRLRLYWGDRGGCAERHRP